MRSNTANNVSDLRLQQVTEGERGPAALEAQVALLLGWERRKRRESTLIVALFYTFLAALAVPLVVSLAPRWAWVPPAAILAILAPYLLITRRWRDADTARALAALDKKMRLDERATTAWELLRRNETKAVAQLVLRQAAERLERFDARALFPRSWGWQAWLLPPLIALWAAMLYFDARFELYSAAPRQVSSLARELREYARELQQKAQNERLPKTLEAARDLEKRAQRAIEQGTADEAFKNELADAGKKMAAERRAAGEAPFAASASRRELADLRAELEAARESFGRDDSEAQAWQDRLAGLSQLKKQLDAQPGGGRELSRGEVKGLLDKLEQNVTGELDRRALMETEEFLKSLPQRDQDRRADGQPRPGGRAERDGDAERWAPNIPGTSPGDARGEKGDAQPTPQNRGAQRAQVKGMIGEGERSTTFFKAKPAPGKSSLSQDEVVASYRRQAESELGTERIPEELKDTIRNYFLSLEKTK
jgi:hypothetical protein